MEEKRFTIHWILSYCSKNFCGFAFDKNKQLLAYILALKMALIKLVGKPSQFVENSESFSQTAFIVYGIAQYSGRVRL